MPEKILLTGIASNNQLAKENFKFELETDDVPMRWSGIKNGTVDRDTKYIGFVYHDANNKKLLVIYNILKILKPKEYKREHWTEDHDVAQTILIGDLVSVISYKRYATSSKGKDGEYYTYRTLPRCNQVRNINNALISSIPEDIALNPLFTFNGVSLIKNRITSSRVLTEDRYELVFKKTLDHNFPGKFVHNELVRDEGKKIFPDFRAEIEGFTLIVEYDERNHSDRDPIAEVSRMDRLKNHFRPNKMIFFRYGNTSQSWKDANRFLATLNGIFDGTSLPTFKKDTAIFLGYSVLPYVLLGWKVRHLV